MVTENSDNTDEVVEKTPKKTKAKKPKYDAVQELPEYDADLKQYIFSFRINGTEETKEVVASSQRIAASLLGFEITQVVFGTQVDYKG